MWKSRQLNSSSDWALCLFFCCSLFVCLLLILCLFFLLKLSLLLNKHMQYNLVFGGRYNYMDVFEVKMRASFRHNTEASDSHIVRFWRIYFSAEFRVTRPWSALWTIDLFKSCQTLSNSPWQGQWGKSTCRLQKDFKKYKKYKLTTMNWECVLWYINTPHAWVSSSLICPASLLPTYLKNSHESTPTFQSTIFWKQKLEKDVLHACQFPGRALPTQVSETGKCGFWGIHTTISEKSLEISAGRKEEVLLHALKSSQVVAEFPDELCLRVHLPTLPTLPSGAQTRRLPMNTLSRTLC